MKELYIRFLIWLGAAPPEGYEYHIPSDEVENSSFRNFANFGFSFIRLLRPSENFVILTNLTPKETQQKLLAAFRPLKVFRPALSNHKRHQVNINGNININGNKFNIRNVLIYRSSFPYRLHSIPAHIQGEIHPNPKGTTIEIKMGLHNSRMLARSSNLDSKGSGG